MCLCVFFFFLAVDLCFHFFWGMWIIWLQYWRKVREFPVIFIFWFIWFSLPSPLSYLLSSRYLPFMFHQTWIFFRASSLDIISRIEQVEKIGQGLGSKDIHTCKHVHQQASKISRSFPSSPFYPSLFLPLYPFLFLFLPFFILFSFFLFLLILLFSFLFFFIILSFPPIFSSLLSFSFILLLFLFIVLSFPSYLSFPPPVPSSLSFLFPSSLYTYSSIPLYAFYTSSVPPTSLPLFISSVPQ